METWMWIAIGVGVIVALVLVGIAIAAIVSKRRRNARQTARLREGFGPEYETAVDEKGRSGGEEDLLERQQRANLFHVRPLSASEAKHFKDRWTVIQIDFVEDPGAALTAADRLLVEVIAARGYPASEFEQSTSALSVDHPRTVQEYRAGHEVAQRIQRNAVPTEDIRLAMVQYRGVFTELLEKEAPTMAAPAATPGEADASADAVDPSPGRREESIDSSFLPGGTIGSERNEPSRNGSEQDPTPASARHAGGGGTEPRGQLGR